MNKQTEALKMAYKAEETGNLQDLVDAVNMLVEVVEALAQPAQEPVAFTNEDELSELKSGMTTCYMYKQAIDDNDIALYTHPAPSWQGLSEEEFIYFTSFVNAETLSEIEKTFREKNYGKV